MSSVHRRFHFLRHKKTCYKGGKREIFFDGFGTSKAVDNPYFADSLRIFAMQQGKRQAIAFHNDLPVVDFYAVSKEYAELLTDDGVHFKKEGHQFLAEMLMQAVREVIF